MGILDSIFSKRKDIAWMYDYDLIEDLTNQAYVKRLALDSCIEFLSKAVAQSHFKVMENTKINKNDVYYKLNIKPNSDLSSDTFWQTVIYKLIYDNEVLIVVSDSKELLIADNFSRKEYALYDDVFQDVTIKEFTFERSFTMDEVIYLKFNNNGIRDVVNSLFEDYGKIFGRMISAQMRNYQIRGIVKTDTNATEKIQQQKLKNYIQKIFKAFSENQTAIVPLTKGFEYQELSGANKGSNVAFKELQELLSDSIRNVAVLLGIPPSLIIGETADLEKNTKVFEKYCLMPLLKKIQNELNAKLYTQSDYLNGNHIEIVGVNKKDPLEFAEQADKLVSSGVFTRNHVRVMLGEEPSDNPELDEYLITKNYEKTNTLKGGENKNED